MFLPICFYKNVTNLVACENYKKEYLQKNKIYK